MQLLNTAKIWKRMKGMQLCLSHSLTCLNLEDSSSCLLVLLQLNRFLPPEIEIKSSICVLEVKLKYADALCLSKANWRIQIVEKELEQAARWFTTNVSC